MNLIFFSVLYYLSHELSSSKAFKKYVNIGIEEIIY